MLTTETMPLLPLQLPGLLFCSKIGECLQQQPPPPPPGDLCWGVVGGGTARLFDRLRDEPRAGAGTPEDEDGEGDGPGFSLGEGSALRETVTPLWGYVIRAWVPCWVTVIVYREVSQVCLLY